MECTAHYQDSVHQVVENIWRFPVMLIVYVRRFKDDMPYNYSRVKFPLDGLNVAQAN